MNRLREKAEGRDIKLPPEGVWRRKKWRGSPGSVLDRCLLCGLPIHRMVSYYVRPAYTDGRNWICVRCMKNQIRRTGKPHSNRYARKPEADKQPR